MPCLFNRKILLIFKHSTERQYLTIHFDGNRIFKEIPRAPLTSNTLSLAASTLCLTNKMADLKRVRAFLVSHPDLELIKDNNDREKVLRNATKLRSTKCVGIDDFGCVELTISARVRWRHFIDRFGIFPISM